MNLTISVVESVKSHTLVQVLEGIVDKLREAVKSRFIRHVEEYGYSKLVARARIMKKPVKCLSKRKIY